MPFASPPSSTTLLGDSVDGEGMLPEAERKASVGASGGGRVWVHLQHGELTVLEGVGIGRQAQGGGAVLTLEAAPVEELALGAQPLHHVDPLLAEIAGVAASYVLWELLLYGALGEGGTGQGEVS